ncbi:Gfo/Idh/MocA family protein [Halococcoides cellulosivorans]|uniref:Glucose-fructose oxidoreductase n=1 Tax=Halococcoides cellulosivorans TaxID=1679096 RepID=A0A2R4X1Z3_9EURY|nr:Gfo/Idh/MocA family oxidoreductase [Halococcoides cellulosivorans]AWB27819.1 glucose-fructose oxidoreductase [Halococcoides cellulosivorans]
MTRVAIVGTGENPDEPDRTGYAMAYRHADAYAAIDDCDLVAAVDRVPGRVKSFARQHGLSGDGVFTEHERMLDVIEPDLVSVCTPPSTHADIVVDCAEAGVPAVHCEKPMAHTWGASRRMARVADREGTRLTFNHQRRFAAAVQEAQALIDEGIVGSVVRVEAAAPTLFDYGTHSVDLVGAFVGERDPEWVFGQVDPRDAKRYFGVFNASQALAQWRYSSGVEALIATGEAAGPGLIGAHHRIVGADGVIELGVGYPDEEAADRHRYRVDGGDWQTFETDESIHSDAAIERALRNVVETLSTDTPSPLGVENALRATKLVFGTYESARRTERVTFPLQIDDNPLAAMVADRRA